MNNKGYSFVEMLISIVILSIVLLSVAEFASNVLNITSRHSQQIEKAVGTRISAERISDKINKAAYIYPGNVDLTLNINGGGQITVSTSDSVAILIPSMNQWDDLQLPEDQIFYDIVVFYLVDQTDGSSNLYEFVSDGYVFIWGVNTSPLGYSTSFDGTITLLTEDIDTANSNLNYILNYDNGISDTILKGEVSNATVNDTDALIQGVEWNLAIKKFTDSTVSIKGVSKSVPRCLD